MQWNKWKESGITHLYRIVSNNYFETFNDLTIEYNIQKVNIKIILL